MGGGGIHWVLLQPLHDGGLRNRRLPVTEVYSPETLGGGWGYYYHRVTYGLNVDCWLRGVLCVCRAL